jgi:predicted kinase
MSLTVTVLKGLPGSRKSSWAKEQVDKNINGTKIINKDSLRLMFDNSHYSNHSEEFIKKARKVLIELCLVEGKHVILDDTNLKPTDEQSIRDIVREITSEHGLKVSVKVQDFTDIPLERCIADDLKRLNSVGEKVIRDMYDKYLKPKKIELVQDETLEKVAIIDIDGTVCEKNNRSPFDWKKVGEDTPRKNIISIVETLAREYKIIFMSGRDECCYKETHDWILTYFSRQVSKFENHELHMRPKDDMRKDVIIKKELYEKYVEGKYYVVGVLDDRDQTVNGWRSIGLDCLQVAEGQF